MGLKCGNTINFGINNIDFKCLLTIVKFRVSRRSSNIDVRPVIDIDASWVIRRFCSYPLSMRLNYLMSMCMLFILDGCCVYIICDGEHRCHTKRATTKRTADLHRQSLNYHSSKCKLPCMMEQMKAFPLFSDNIEYKKE